MTIPDGMTLESLLKDLERWQALSMEFTGHTNSVDAVFEQAEQERRALVDFFDTNEKLLAYEAELIRHWPIIRRALIGKPVNLSARVEHLMSRMEGKTVVEKKLKPVVRAIEALDKFSGIAESLIEKGQEPEYRQLALSIKERTPNEKTTDG